MVFVIILFTYEVAVKVQQSGVKVGGGFVIG